VTNTASAAFIYRNGFVRPRCPVTRVVAQEKYFSTRPRLNKCKASAELGTTQNVFPDRAHALSGPPTPPNFFIVLPADLTPKISRRGRLHIPDYPGVHFEVAALLCSFPTFAMSALGQKQTYALQKPMSALPPIATAKADTDTFMATPPRVRKSAHVRPQRATRRL
jgi:hypothetical protein